MTELQLIALYVFGYVMGAVFGYIQWAPMTPFKRAFLTGMTFGFWKDKT